MPRPDSKRPSAIRFVWEAVILPIVAIIVYIIKIIAEDWDNRDG